MNREDIVRMAQETGVTAERVRDLVNFAALVASAEREACADMVYRYISQTVNMEARGCLASVAYDIRARGEKHG